MTDRRKRAALERLFRGFITPPEATPSISVVPAQVDASRIQSPEAAKRIFTLGLRRTPTSAALDEEQA